VLSFDISLLKGEAPRFSTYLPTISHEKSPFQFPRHLPWALEFNGIIVKSDKYFHSAVKTDMETENGHGNGKGNGNGNRN
jgi:hypothetical protein